MNPILKRVDDLEAKIQAAIIKELMSKGWFVMETHGNMFQKGFPDLFCTHSKYRQRWLEVKKPVGYAFTAAQLEHFPKLEANGSPIWVATTHIDVETLLMRPSNWFHYLEKTRRCVR